jgi:protein-tyrosine phosphatase
LIPLVDTHCHLLAALDDGPQTWDEALEMCQVAWDDGTRAITATAHQNETWPDVSPESIRAATKQLAQRLAEAKIPLEIYPSAEVAVFPGMSDAWQQGQLLSVADHRQYLLIELPHNLFVDIRGEVNDLRQRGIYTILAHPERHAELLFNSAAAEELIMCGCLMQFSAQSVAAPRDRRQAAAIRDWIQRGLVHLVASDGHSPRRRPPGLSAAYAQIVSWVGPAVADRLCSSQPMAVIEGYPLTVPAPARAKRSWTKYR